MHLSVIASLPCLSALSSRVGLQSICAKGAVMCVATVCLWVLHTFSPWCVCSLECLQSKRLCLQACVCSLASHATQEQGTVDQFIDSKSVSDAVRILHQVV